MATKKKMLQAAAGNAGGAGLDVESVFSTYLYDGNSSTQTITNGIDLDGEGGLVWSKRRSSANNHILVDTERGAGNGLRSNATSASISESSVIGFNSDGYDLGSESAINYSGSTNVSWTFRKAPKFFDVVATWTGDGTGGRTISHNLGSIPGVVVAKSTNAAQEWFIYHRSLGNTKYLHFNTDAAATNAGAWNNTTPTSTEFTVGSYLNVSGRTYVAYLFAHNNSDGEFGPDGDQDIIKCGSYTGNGSTDGPEIDLGFEPQWVMIKRTDTSIADSWIIHDTMRGIASGGTDPYLLASSSASENSISVIDVTPTGFKLTAGYGGWDGSGGTYIYIAIRRGPLAQPESATEVFEVFETTNTGTASTIGSMGPADFILNKRTDGATAWRALDRLRNGSMLRTESTDTETSSGFLEWDKMGGVFVTAQGAPYITNDSQAHWMWKRAPGFFDAVAYTGIGTAGRTVSHNLGVAPEMMWVKGRNYVENWGVYHKDVGATKYLMLNQTSAEATYTGAWNDTAPTSSVFTLGGWNAVNEYTYDYIAYLFASLDGISKVGSYTGTGSDQNIDCGFTSGARFVLIKRYSSTSPWSVFDSARGITSSTTDPYLFLNSTAAEATDAQRDLDPYSSGFTLAGNDTDINASGSSYIFYAIA